MSGAGRTLPGVGQEWVVDDDEPIVANQGRFGPYVQLGDNPERGSKDKPKRASLERGMSEDGVSLSEALRLGGALGERRVLSPAMVAYMRQNHTGERPNGMMTSSRALHGMPAFPAYLGLGLFLRGSGVFPSHMPTLASSGTFGGWGLGSMGFWVDPEREVSFVMLTAGIMERIRNLLRFQRIGDMVLASLEEG